MRITVATREDVAGIIALLADDPLGKTREDTSDPLNPTYEAAFAALSDDPNQRLFVMKEGDDVIGCAQLTLIPGLSRKGMWRGQIEAVRVAQSHQGSGLGRSLIEHCIEVSKDNRCGLVQLTSDKSREDAHAFYDALGFKASHEGYKLSLER